MKRILMTTGLWLGMALSVQSATPQEVDELASLIGLPDIINVMRDEGIEYGGELANEMFPDRQSGWDRIVGRIYDGEWMTTVVSEKMQAELADTDITPLTDYFSGTIGSQIIALEVSARIALMDAAVEDASNERLAQMMDNDDPRLRLIDRYVDANDLLENNVVGSLNSNFAFFSGLVDGGGLPSEMTESEMLRDVWSQEPEIREDTREWLYSYLAMAYQPLGDDDLASYIALSETPAGQDMNRALFNAFNGMFDLISRALGEGAAQMMSGQEL